MKHFNNRSSLLWLEQVEAYGASSTQHPVSLHLLVSRYLYISLWSLEWERYWILKEKWLCWLQMPILEVLQLHVQWPQPKDGILWWFLGFLQAYLELPLQISSVLDSGCWFLKICRRREYCNIFVCFQIGCHLLFCTKFVCIERRTRSTKFILLLNLKSANIIEALL